jgi:hypothetical protein
VPSWPPQRLKAPPSLWSAAEHTQRLRKVVKERARPERRQEAKLLMNDDQTQKARASAANMAT